MTHALLRISRRRASRRLAAAAALLLGTTAVACSGTPAPEEAASCEQLVEVGVAWVEDTASALEGQPLEVVTGDVPPPEELSDLQAVGVAIDARAEELGCSNDELHRAIAAAVAELESDDPVVSLFLRIVQSNAAATIE